MKRHLKNFLLRTRAPRMLAKVGPKQAVILRYHSVQPSPRDYSNTIGEGIIHSQALFAKQMEAVSRQFNPVTIDEIVLWLQGKRSLPRRAVAITFDDGYADNYTIAAPILVRFGLKASFYITVRSIGTKYFPWYCRLRHSFYSTSVQSWTDFTTDKSYDIGEAGGKMTGFLAACRICAQLTGERQEVYLDTIEQELHVPGFPNDPSLMMDWDQAKALYDAGHTIGSHTMTHPNVAYADPNEARNELRESKVILERQLDCNIEHFSYPSPILEPHCSEETKEMLTQSEYLSAVTCLPGPVSRRNSPLCLPRVSTPQDQDEFLWALEASLAGRVI